MKKTKPIIFLLILILLLGTIYYANEKGIFENGKPIDENKNNDEININETQTEEEKNYLEIPGTKEINGIELSNIKITLIEEDKCEFTANVKNKTEEYKKATNLRIKTKDENGETKEIFGGWITDLIPREENIFKTYILKNILDAKDVEFEEIE